MINFDKLKDSATKMLENGKQLTEQSRLNTEIAKIKGKHKYIIIVLAVIAVLLLFNMCGGSEQEKVLDKWLNAVYNEDLEEMKKYETEFRKSDTIDDYNIIAMRGKNSKTGIYAKNCEYIKLLEFEKGRDDKAFANCSKHHELVCWTIKLRKENGVWKIAGQIEDW